MKILYFVRHGQTLFNVHHKIQGACDSPLTQVGIRQAQAVHDYFQDHQIQIDEAFCSTQERASDTLEIITHCQVPYRRLKNLREKSHGLYEGQDEFMLPWRRGFSRNNPAFEPDEQVEKRMETAVHEILQATSEGENILIVSHGTILRLFTKEINPDFKAYDNCGVVKMIAENGNLSYVGAAHPAENIR